MQSALVPPISPPCRHGAMLLALDVVEYTEQGRPGGVPVVLIHGWPDSVSSFDLVRPLLSPELHVFTVGLRPVRSDKM